MKNFIVKSLAALAVLVMSLLFSVNADARKEAQSSDYHYGWITSCGYTEYRTYDHELGDDRLVEILDELEAEHCCH
jgi:hypothetical protein